MYLAKLNIHPDIDDDGDDYDDDDDDDDDDADNCHQSSGEEQVLGAGKTGR